MTREVIPYTDKDTWLKNRAMDITSTEVSALFGISPYVTEYELWHRKKAGDIVEIEDNERMAWGRRLQDAIAAGIAEDRGVPYRRVDEYMRLPDLRIGSSFDFLLEESKILEIKNVDWLQYKEKWTDDEGPLHIEIQIQHQMLVMGADVAIIGVLVGGNEKHEIERHANPKIHEGIKKKVASFWKSIDENKPPEPNLKTDYSFINTLYGYAEPNKVVDAAGNEQLLRLAKTYKAAAALEKSAKEDKDVCKAQILQMIGDAEKVIGDGYKISAGIVGETHISYVRKSYRDFRISGKGLVE